MCKGCGCGYISAGADWLQGPYVYALYTHYGYDIQQIGILFIVGFGTAAVFGTFVGSAADRYGRKNVCLLFGVIYGISCIVKHWGDFRMLLIGRVLAGVATSILFSAFESWMVSQHHSAGYKEEWLSVTFSIATSGNGVIAILAGVMAGFVRDRFGPVAPFDLSLILLIIGTAIVFTTWEENYGDRSSNVGATMLTAWDRLKNDRKIVLLGVIQACFEGSMYVRCRVDFDGGCVCVCACVFVRDSGCTSGPDGPACVIRLAMPCA